MNPKQKNILNFLLRVVFSGALLVYISSKINWKETFEVLHSADIKFLILGVLFFLGLHLFLIARWMVLIRALGLDVSIRDVIRCFFMGLFGNLFLPTAIGGDIIKTVGLCNSSSQRPRVVASVILDRLSGFASMVIIATVAYLLGMKLVDDSSILLVIGIIATASVASAGFLFHEGLYTWACQIFGRIPKIKENLMKLHYDIVLLKDKKSEGFKAIGLSILSQMTFCVVFYFVSRALNQDIAILYFFIFVPLLCVMSLFPSIGGLGVREMGAAYLFGKAGMAAGVAVSMSLINFLFMVLIGLIGGAVYVFTLPSRRLQHHSPDSKTA